MTEPLYEAHSGRARLPRILVLARTGINLKNILFGPFFPALNGKAEVRVATDYHEDPHLGAQAAAQGIQLEPFLHTKRRKRSLTSRFESFVVAAWDQRGLSQTRLSKRRLLAEAPRHPAHAAWQGGLRLAQRAAAGSRLLDVLDERLEAHLLRTHPSVEMIEGLRRWKPDVVLSTLPYRASDMALARAARHLGIPVVASLTSWDNLTTKNRITFTYDGYLLWSEQMRAELHRLYARTCRKPYWVVGAPNFDAHLDAQWRLTREAFCRRMGLDPARKIIFYGTGARGLAAEHLVCQHLAKAIQTGRVGEAQLLVRLHPLNDDPAYDALKAQFPAITVRFPGRDNLGMLARSPCPTAEGITELINSILHADVVINLASTLSIEAALLDRPIVNVAYDPEPRQNSRIEDVYTVYDHYRPIVDSGGVRLARSEDALLEEINRYLHDPTLDRQGRRRIVEIEVGRADGRAGERMALRLLDVARTPLLEPAEMPA